MGIAVSTSGHLLNEREVAAILAVSVASVRRWRLLNQGPKFLKLGSAVRYREEDLARWLDSRPVGGELKAH
jgi:predicted DNA-binding transcriptional regulator AlpA